ncbi:hypothetical protein [Microbacterium sp.]|uniref:hypothetical protein n=1 Tax=Microbacterium sp. TaxID=51671 RepID=UPI002812312E|nr:hypothetical protein [Microbacterium sp.]
MNSTPPEGTAPQQDAAAVARSNADARAKVLAWARRSIDLIPTKWLITGAGAVLLAATAVFGGLETVPASPVPELAVGDTFAGSDLEVTVRAVELRDERGDAAVFPDEGKGEKALVVVLDVVNTFTSARSAATADRPSPALDGIRVDGVEGAPALTRAGDEGLVTPRLQPDVPVRVIAAWVVGPKDLRPGESVRISLPDSTHYVGKSVMSGDYWADVRLGAWVDARIEAVAAP